MNCASYALSALFDTPSDRGIDYLTTRCVLAHVNAGAKSLAFTPVQPL